MNVKLKGEIVSRLLKSNTFLKSPKSSALLKYLVNAELEGSYLKESIIDIEFFGGNVDLDKTSARVRVNVYNLRKKLAVYHAVEGKKDSWRLVIDKGQYSVRYEKVLPTKNRPLSINFWRILPYTVIVLLLAFLYVQDTDDNLPKLWHGYVENNDKTTMYIGDAYGLSGKTITGSIGITRDFNINNAEEYYKFIEERPEFKNQLKPAEYSYVTGMGAHAANNLSRLFANYDRGFSIRFASKTSYEDLKEGNIVYVGPFHKRPKFVTLFNKENVHFKITDSILKMENIPNKKDSVISLYDMRPDMEYAIVSRSKSINNKEQFLFFSNHDIGVLGAVEFFSNKDSLSLFSDKYLKEKNNFTAVYKVYGKDRTNMKIETLIVVPF